MKIKSILSLIVFTLALVTINFKLTDNNQKSSSVTLSSIISQAFAQDESGGGGCDYIVHSGWYESGTDSNGCTVDYYCEGEFCYPSGESKSVSCYFVSSTC